MFSFAPVSGSERPSTQEERRLGLVAPLGRMGYELLAQIIEKDLPLSSVYLREKDVEPWKTQAEWHPKLSEVTIYQDLHAFLESIHTLIDFSSLELLDEILTIGERLPFAWVCGTTGLSEVQLAALEERAKVASTIWSPNMSYGVNFLSYLLEFCSASLPAEDYDVEIVDSHHRFKADAPSGTALFLAEALKTGNRQNIVTSDRYSLSASERDSGDIGISCIRGGSVVGEHTVHFMGMKESISLSHQAHHRSVFASGALIAWEWLEAQGFPIGQLWGMHDLFKT